MKAFLFTITFLLFSSLTFGQLGEVKIEARNGEKVYVHIVQKGNTLWGLYKLYDVPVEKIIEKNPGVENGLQEGQIVYIPVPIITEQNTHLVLAGETLYSIARKYDVDVKELEKWNPEAAKGLKEGQKLMIYSSTYITGEKATPVVTKEEKTADKNPITVTFNDSIVEHIVVEGETLYAISRRYMVPADKIISFNKKKNNVLKPGEVLKIPLKKERISGIKLREIPQKEVARPVDEVPIFNKKSEYKVAILLPFMLNKGVGYSERISNMSAEFLMGAQMALDSLEKMGLNAKVFVYDVENDEAKVKSILEKPEMTSMDLIIGPLNKVHAPTIAAWCLEHKIRMVCPVNIDTKILQGNPYVYTTIGSDITLIKGMAQFITQKFKGENVILVKPSSAKDSILYQAFRTEYKRLAENGKGKLIETTPENISKFLSVSAKLAIVYPTNDPKSVVGFMNELSRFVHKFGANSYVFGTEAWLDMDGINAFYRNKYRITIPSSMDLNYTYDRTKIYHRKYRTLYGSDFTKVAIQGFDVMFNYCYGLLLGQKAGQLIMNNFESIQVGPNHGYENKNVEILSHENFTLINISE